VVEHRKIRQLGRRGGATLLTLGLALGGFSVFAAPGAGAAGNDPGGNQGVVKIVDGTNPAIDVTDVSNNPHVDCLGIEWFNFAKGAETTYTVTQVAPTVGGVAASWSGSLDDLGPLNNDDADGSLDAFTTPTLSLTGAPKAQGWHVEVHVETTAANGNVDKNKTVWVSNDCAPDDGGNEPTSGTLSISKSVVNNDGGSHTGFGFSVSCPGAEVSGGSATFTLDDGGATTRTVTGQLPLDCTVTETDAKGADATTVAVDGGEAAAAASTSATVSTGQTTEVAFTNTFDEQGCVEGCENPPSQAAIRVNKAVTGTTAPQGGTFPFTVACTTGTVTNGSFNVAAGASATATVTWDGATAPSCTVTETDARGAASTTYTVDGGSAQSGTQASTGTLADGATSVVSFTNAFRSGGDIPVPPVIVVDLPTTTIPTPPTTLAPVVQPEVIVPTTLPTKVEGVQVVAPAPPAQVQPAQLARTGAMTDHLIVAAGLCLLLGGVVLTASKERTAVPTRRR
jgi:hypothetical protein